jgi:hypothetical protein
MSAQLSRQKSRKMGKPLLQVFASPGDIVMRTSGNTIRQSTKRIRSLARIDQRLKRDALQNVTVTKYNNLRLESSRRRHSY